jgi:sulfur relay (sulfurtransferase) complex TusBCD TusD component (DsrE family)
MSQKTFAIALMDAPYESENLTTAFRILDAMARRGHNIKVSPSKALPA